MREIQLAFISNRTTKRLFRILSVIERERQITLNSLAEKIQVTQRTVANDLKYIKEYFGSSITLSSGNSGYIFKEKVASVYHEKKQILLKNECLFEIIGDIFHGRFNKIDDLAHKYHFSASTFRRLLIQCSTILDSYELQWGTNLLTIEGSEANLRKFFKDFYYEGIETAYTIVPEPELHELIFNQLSSKLKRHEIGSGVTPTAFYYTVYIAVKRAGLGFEITVPEELAQWAYEGKSFPLLYSLKEGIRKIYGVTLSKEEFAWIYLVTICKRTFGCEAQEKKFCEQFHEGADIVQVTDDFLKEQGITTDLVHKAAPFFRSFFLSRQINNWLAPVLNKEADDFKKAIRRTRREVYRYNLQFLTQNNQRLFSSHTLVPYLEDICVSLTLYCELILDVCSPKKTIYFLLEGDHFICQQIRLRATQQFGDKHVLTFISLQYLTKEVLKNASIDLVVTNYKRNLLDYITETEYVLIKAVPDEQDWDHLERKINPYRKKLL